MLNFFANLKSFFCRLKVEDPTDLSRDVLKSETCAVKIPELDLESEGIALSGKFTTVEGLLLDLKDVVSGRIWDLSYYTVIWVVTIGIFSLIIAPEIALSLKQLNFLLDTC